MLDSLDNLEEFAGRFRNVGGGGQFTSDADRRGSCAKKVCGVCQIHTARGDHLDLRQRCLQGSYVARATDAVTRENLDELATALPRVNYFGWGKRSWDHQHTALANQLDGLGLEP